MPRTEKVHEDATLRMGRLKNLLVFAWFGPPEVVHVRALGRELQALSTRYRGEIAALDLLVSGTPSFKDEARDELVRLLRDPRKEGRGAAHVVEVGGLAGAAVRAFLSTVLLLARPARPNKVFADITPAATWLLPHLWRAGEAWSVADVVAAAEEVRGRAAP
jgi:hypothetical protein